jgi:hypothetical protein
MAAPTVEIITHPIRPADLSIDGWWQDERSLRLYASEYTKYLVTWLRYSLYRLTI